MWKQKHLLAMVDGGPANTGGQTSETDEAAREAPTPDQGPKTPHQTPVEGAASDTHEKQGRDVPEDRTKEDLWAEVQKLRNENAKRRNEAKNAAHTYEQQLAEIAQTLGITTKEEDPTPEQLQDTITNLTSERDSAAKQRDQAILENAVWKTATKTGADPTALLDSRSFLDSLNGIDPTNTDQLTAKISEAVKDNPRFATKTTDWGAYRTQAHSTAGRGEKDRNQVTIADALAARTNQ